MAADFSWRRGGPVPRRGWSMGVEKFVVEMKMSSSSGGVEDPGSWGKRVLARHGDSGSF